MCFYVQIYNDIGSLLHLAPRVLDTENKKVNTSFTNEDTSVCPELGIFQLSLTLRTKGFQAETCLGPEAVLNIYENKFTFQVICSEHLS